MALPLSWCCWCYGTEYVLSSLLSLRRWVEVLPDSNSLYCKCKISKCGWKWEFMSIFGQKDLYNFTLSGQPAAKVSMKTDTNIFRKYYLTRKIANLKYQKIFQFKNLWITKSQKILCSYFIAIYIFLFFTVKVVLYK